MRRLLRRSSRATRQRATEPAGPAGPRGPRGPRRALWAGRAGPRALRPRRRRGHPRVERLDRRKRHPRHVGGSDRAVVGTEPEGEVEVLRSGSQMARRSWIGSERPGRQIERPQAAQHRTWVGRRLIERRRALADEPARAHLAESGDHERVRGRACGHAERDPSGGFVDEHEAVGTAARGLVGLQHPVVGRKPRGRARVVELDAQVVLLQAQRVEAKALVVHAVEADAIAALDDQVVRDHLIRRRGRGEQQGHACGDRGRWQHGTHWGLPRIDVVVPPVPPTR